ncbi:MAG: class II aldolase/adducin family protein [Bacteroidota bacterium]|nr:class II aldolase/adducin family protein [Bacteroidota bacterium]
MTIQSNISTEIINVCRRVEAKGFVSATDGNISVRLQNGNILATPTSLNKGLVRAEDLVELSLDGKQISGKRKPSTEMKMHLFIYQHRNDVNAVVHCHPIYATGFAAAGIPLKENVFPEVIVGFGNIPLAAYATPSTEEVGESLRPFVKTHDAILLSNHGVVTYGNDVWDAYFRMEKVEHIAHTLFVAETLGGTKQLSSVQVARLKELAKTVHRK